LSYEKVVNSTLPQNIFCFYSRMGFHYKCKTAYWHTHEHAGKISNRQIWIYIASGYYIDVKRRNTPFLLSLKSRLQLFSQYANPKLYSIPHHSE